LNQEEHLNSQVEALAAELATSETALLLQLWEQSLENKKVALHAAETSRAKLGALFKKASLSISVKANVSDIFSTIKARMSELAEEIKKTSESNALLAEQVTLLKQQATPLRQDIEHLSTHQTLIDPGLYNIKTAALKELKLPKNSLMFIGELLSVKSPELRIAAESALEPIAKNLLVHPDYLDVFTPWLNKNNLAKSITVKRLTALDLKETAVLQPSVENSILTTLEIRSSQEHPFSGYMALWLNNSFDYQVVEVKEFKKGKSLLVTKEGLVKRDSFTMRKLSKNLRYTLGWNPEERIAQLAAELAQLLEEINTKEVTVKTTASATDDQRILLNTFSEYKTVQDLEFINVDHLHEQIKDLRQQITDLKRKDQKHHDRKELLEKLKLSLRKIQETRAGMASELERLKRVLKELKERHSELRQTYESSRHLELLRVTESLEQIELRLNENRNRLTKNQDEVLEHIEGKEKDLETKKDSLIAAVNRLLTQYQDRFGDPQLVYQLRDISILVSVTQDWNLHKERLEGTELAGLEMKWQLFFSDILIKSIKDTLNEIKSQRLKIESNIQSINDVLKLNHFEKLPTENRFLQIHSESSSDARVRTFRRSCLDIENLLASPALRVKLENASKEVLAPLEKFVNDLKEDPKVREFVTDVRNHFEFEVRSWSQKDHSPEVELAETFTGSRNDAKSSAQTTQLAYTLLASSLAYRFKFNDPVAGQNTPRMIILDEFGGKFDNEKPRDIIKMLSQMGFQSLLVSPMTKAELLADSVNTINLVHKASASKSKVQHYVIQSKEDYDKLIRSMAME
ncbi:MAG TPA: SbcC/MukB-like Walker B domain-containing protein, partial [Pseudobdellovibrionaceae bacterium]